MSFQQILASFRTSGFALKARQFKSHPLQSEVRRYVHLQYNRLKGRLTQVPDSRIMHSHRSVWRQDIVPMTKIQACAFTVHTG